MPQFANLSGRVALVTGASTGIGRAIAVEMARGGADVIVHYRKSIAAAEGVAAECRAIGVQSRVLPGDLSDLATLNSFAAAAWESWGRVDFWINNAGADLLTGDDARLDYAAKLQKLFDVDVRSTMLLGREARASDAYGRERGNCEHWMGPSAIRHGRRQR